jgi:hypothetical protein
MALLKKASNSLTEEEKRFIARFEKIVASNDGVAAELR